MAIDRKQLGLAIRELRKARGLTQVTLAGAAGLSGSGNTVAMIERGERGVSIDTLNSLADALKVDAACLTVLGSTVPASSGTSQLMQTLRDQVLSMVNSVNKPVPRRSVSATAGAESLEVRQLKSAIAVVVMLQSAPTAMDASGSDTNIGSITTRSNQSSRRMQWSQAAQSSAARFLESVQTSVESGNVDEVMTLWHTTDWWQEDEDSASMN